MAVDMIKLSLSRSLGNRALLLLFPATRTPDEPDRVRLSRGELAIDAGLSRDTIEPLGINSATDGDDSSPNMVALVYRPESFGVGGASLASNSSASDVCLDCRKREDAVDERFELLRVEDAMDGGLGGGAGILEAIEDRAAASVARQAKLID